MYTATARNVRVVPMRPLKTCLRLKAKSNHPKHGFGSAKNRTAQQAEMARESVEKKKGTPPMEVPGENSTLRSSFSDKAPTMWQS